MHLSWKAKDAIKTAVAMVLVFYIGLRSAWMNPYWAGIAVMSLSMPTVGQSLNKGVLRVGGTIIGAAAALLYLGLFPQDRFALIAIVGLHMGFVTYRMMGSKHAYVWQVSGLGCLIIAVAGPGSSSALFERAAFRTLETTLGIVIVTLVWVFLWPQSDRSALGDLSKKLVATKRKLFEAIRDQTLKRDSADSIPALQKQLSQLVQQFGQSLEAAGAEAYDVRKLRPLLNRFRQLSSEVMETYTSWEESLTEVRQVDIQKIVPNLEVVNAELDTRFQEIQRMLDGKPPEQVPGTAALDWNRTELQALSHFDRAAVVVVKDGLEKLDSLTRSLFDCVREQTSPGNAQPAQVDRSAPKSSGFPWPVLDPDRLRASIMVMATLWVGFFTWVLFNPPGHTGWTQLTPTIALIFAKLRVVSPIAALKAMGTAVPIGLLAYVFILPHLSTFWELGVAIFAYTFAVTYVFPSGAGKSAGLLGMLTTWGITNQQSYNFAGAMNSYLFTLMAILTVLAMSYIIQAPRPEKAFLSQLERYFKSAGFLLSRVTFPLEGRPSFWERYRSAFHRQQVATLPQQIGARGHFVSQKKFPHNSAEQIQSVVASLTVLSHRIAALDQASTAPQAERLVHELLDHVRQWRFAMADAFQGWSKDPAAAPAELSRQLASRLQTFESLISETIDHADKGELSEKESENFYRVLASYRGLSDAALAYAGVAASFDWAHWQEERF